MEIVDSITASTRTAETVNANSRGLKISGRKRQITMCVPVTAANVHTRTAAGAR